FEELADGEFGYRYRTDYGVVNAEEFEAIASFVKESGAEVRLGIDQQIYILGLKERRVPFEHRKTAPTVVACAGSEYCPFSYWSIKDESYMLPQEEIEKNGVIVGFSGC
ncbi:MAG: nitrite/sulfite reductase, partial [Hydrogenimonas sp.]|nr:nitrite/sulfite reductase [Hydrogenimonas sp.]